MILKMPHQQVGEVNLVDEMVDRLLDILADKLTERLSAGHKELYEIQTRSRARLIAD